MANGKPLGHSSYGSIPHLSDSRMGPGDHKCSTGHERIATLKTRDKHDRVIVQEKLDGSNVGVAKINGVIVPLTRAGYVANTSPYEMHHVFYDWVIREPDRFRAILSEGERICGEWLHQAHGTRYKLPHEPFVAFDIIKGHERLPYDEFRHRVDSVFTIPFEISREPIGIFDAMLVLGNNGKHGAIDPAEGAVWRVERNRETDVKGVRKWAVDFLVKYVRPTKQDGIYLPKVSGEPAIINEVAA